MTEKIQLLFSLRAFILQELHPSYPFFSCYICLSMEVVKGSKSFASHFSQKQTQRAREPLGGTVL